MNDNIYILIGKRLKEAREERDKTLEDAGNRIGTHKSTIQRWENGKTEKISTAAIEILADFYNVNPAWLAGKNVSKYNTKIDKFGNSVVSIPLLGEVKAGYNYLAEENWQGTKDISEELAKTGDFFALRIKGDSMFETLWDGDIVAVKKQDYAKDGNLAVILINGDEATIKKIKILDDGIKLIPLNRRINPQTQEPFYEDKFFSKKDIETMPIKIIGIVKQLIERNF